MSDSSRGTAARAGSPTDQLFAQQEDDRPARAIARVPTRPELTEAQPTDWLAPIGADFAAGRTPGVPTTAAHTSNSMRTLRTLYVLADVGVVTERGGPMVRPRHAEALKRRLAESAEPGVPVVLSPSSSASPGPVPAAARASVCRRSGAVFGVGGAAAG